MIVVLSCQFAGLRILSLPRDLIVDCLAHIHYTTLYCTCTVAFFFCAPEERFLVLPQRASQIMWTQRCTK